MCLWNLPPSSHVRDVTLIWPQYLYCSIPRWPPSHTVTFSLCHLLPHCHLSHCLPHTLSPTTHYHLLTLSPSHKQSPSHPVTLLLCHLLTHCHPLTPFNLSTRCHLLTHCHLITLSPSYSITGHPHRGFETCSIMLEGQMEHKDNAGNQASMSPLLFN